MYLQVMSCVHVCHVLRFQIPDTDQLREIAVREERRSATTKHAPTWDPSTDTCPPPVPFVCCPDLRGFPPTQHTGYDYIHPRLGHRATDETPPSHSPTNIRMIHFNNAGASPSPPVVVRAVIDHLSREVELGGYLAAARAEQQLDGVYASAHRLIHGSGVGGAAHDGGGGGGNGIAATSDGKLARREVALVESATVGWTRVFYSMAECLARQARREAAALAASNGNASTDPIVSERILLLSEAEYAANVVAAVKFCREQNELGEQTKIKSHVRWRVLTIPSTTYADADGRTQSTGVVNTRALDDMLCGRWKMSDPDDDDENKQRLLDPRSIVLVLVTHIPTNSGIVNPVDEIGEIIEAHNDRFRGQADDDSSSSSNLPACLYLVDACQSVGQIDVDVRAMRCHALTATGRKYLRGPRGTGFLYVREQVAEALIPSHIDHTAAPVESLPRLSGRGCGTGSFELTESLEFGYQPGAARFELWESNIAAKLGLGAAIDYAMNEVGMATIEEYCCRLGAELRARLRSMDGIDVYHDNGDEEGEKLTGQCGIVTFGVEGLESALIKKRLMDGSSGGACFEVSVVPATSTPVDSAKMMAKDLVRASLSYENTADEVALFVKRLATVIAEK